VAVEAAGTGSDAALDGAAPLAAGGVVAAELVPGVVDAVPAPPQAIAAEAMARIATAARMREGVRG
jgi:hypothetical protein